MTPLLIALRTLNERLAVAAGTLLLISVLVTLFDILARPIGFSLGGTDELSGYTMAIATSWGVCYALTAQAHVRIDLLRAKSGPALRAYFDTLSIFAVALVALTVAYRVWPVLSKTLATGAKANTTLETPLWIPQSLWLAGWMWFAVSACLLALSACVFLAKREHDPIEEFLGLRGEE